MAEISYTKTNWVNNVTKLNADNMNHIESGIKNASDAINVLNRDITDLQTALIGVSDLIGGDA